MGTALESPPGFMEWQDVPSLVGSMRTRSLVARPAGVAQCRETLAYCRRNGLTLCPRGGGRSYGDAALNDGQVLLDVSAMNRILDFDDKTGRVTVESGVRLIDIFEAVHHRQLTLPASPTESHSTVAGAICANVNGKDGWRLGSFGDQVVRLSMMTADGEVLEIDRSHELFGGVVGGMGMLGIVLEATLQLQPVPSPFVETKRLPAAHVDELLERMAEVEASCDAVVVWVDTYARGPHVGRSVIHATRWIERDETEAQRKEIIAQGIERLAAHRRFGLALHAAIGPLISFGLQFQRLAVRLFNRLYYEKSRAEWRAGRNTSIELFLKYSFEASFTVPPAHLVCGPRGYTIQVTFPRSHAREAMVQLLGICQASPCPPVTTVLRVHRADDAIISFSEDGYSLNFEIHPKKRHEAAMRRSVDRLIDAVVRVGGKVHLTKDQVLTPEQFRRVFPRHGELAALKRRLDPEGMFRTDLAARVGFYPVASAGEAPRS
jgi:decaprenylphospho-beta-D-ribofuranose 2-oxidase